MEAPSESDPPSTARKHSINRGAIVACVCGLLLVYTLSVGPVVMLVQKHHSVSASNKLREFYRPLLWAYFNTALHKPLGVYLHQWDPRNFKSNGEIKPNMQNDQWWSDCVDC